jgi:hypothetical protein
MISKIVMAKAEFSTKIFSLEADLNLKNTLVNCYILSTALFGAGAKVKDNIYPTPGHKGSNLSLDKFE